MCANLVGVRKNRLCTAVRSTGSHQVTGNFQSAALRSITIVLLLLNWPNSESSGQGYLDLSKFKAEHVITHGNGPTGDLTIYFSAPNWFAKSAGYCPIHFRVIPQKGLAFKSTGILKISISSSDRISENGPRVVIEIPIEQGATEARGEVLANLMDNQLMNLSVTLNGRRLGGHRLYYWPPRNQTQLYRDLVIISLASSTGDRKRQAAMDEMNKTGKWYSQTEFITGTSNIGSFADATKLPNNWLNYSGLDQVSISMGDLSILSPDSRECINQYAMAGGVLEISEVPSLDAVKKFIDFDPRRKYGQLEGRKNRNPVKSIPQVQPGDLAADYDALVDTVWDKFYKSHSQAAFESSPAYPMNNSYGRPVVAINAVDLAETLAKDLMEVARAYLDFQLSCVETTATKFIDDRGHIVATATVDDPLVAPMTISHGFGIVNLNPRYRRDSSALAVETLNNSKTLSVNRMERFKSGIGDDYWTWLIPSVGRTPVIPFLAFVVLFVGIVVPGLMFWCNQHKRRVWLVVSMPVTAAFFTMLLFGYGIFKDGLGAVSRTRSLTLLDSDGDGMVWSRQSLFAARVPSQGIVLQRDTQVAPLTINSSRDLPDSQQQDRDGFQTYVGLLPPRMQAQYSITHPVRKLQLFRRSEEMDPILHAKKIVNESDFTWTTALFLDSAGHAFVAKDVPHGQVANFTEESNLDAIATILKNYHSRPLLAPADAPSADQISLNQFFGNIFSFNRNRNNMTGQIAEENVWAANLGLKTSSYSDSDNTIISSSDIRLGTPLATLANTYIIFGEHAPYLQRCIPNVEEDSSLHTVIGHWAD
ncbi:MAG: hypothetical protein ABL921_07060 [Pirellula sp.]